MLLVVGVPLVMRLIRVPATLVFEEVPPEELTKRQADFFVTFDRAAAELGYAPVSTFRVTNLPNPNLSRLYLSPRHPAVLYVHALTARQGRAAPVNYCEFVTVFNDTFAITTTNAPRISAFPVFPENPMRVFPGNPDPAPLAKIHEARVEREGQGLPLRLTRDEVFSRNIAFHHRWCAFLVARGILRRRGTRGFSPTWRLAVRGVGVHLNPFAGSFSAGKFMVGVVYGGILPLLADHAAPAAARLLHGWTGADPLLCLEAWTAFGYAVAGIALGWTFECRAFIWGFLLYSLPATLLGRTGSLEIISAGWIGVVANLVSNWKAARRQVA